MDSSFDTPSYSDLGRRVSPTPYRHARRFSNQSIFSVSSYASDLSLTISSTTHPTKPPKYRLHKLIKSSLKHTLKTNKTESNNIEYWNTFYKKLRKIITSFNDPSSLYHALNDPFSGKSSTQTCSSIIHILCKQFYLYARSNNWSVCFKILDCIAHFLDAGANTSIFYTKLTATPQRNYNSIHTLYEGLQILLSSDVITHQQLINHFSRAISAGNNHMCQDMCIAQIDNKKRSYCGFSKEKFNPALLTLCFYRDTDAEKWQNITYWLGDCLYHDYYVNLISPYLAKAFIMMGYDLFHVTLHKFEHLDFNRKEQMDLIIKDDLEIKTVLMYTDINDHKKIHKKVIAFLWFIRFGNFKKDLINIVDIGIKQLAFNEFVVSIEIIEEILSYSHYFVVTNSESTNNNMDKLMLSYFNENESLITAFKMLFKLDSIWIEWIAQFVLPQLNKMQLNKIKKYLSEHTSGKQRNKFIRRISLKAIASFSKYNILSSIDTEKMQNIIVKHYKNNDLIQLLINADYNIVETFGSKLILYNILNDDSLDNKQVDNILNAIHFRVHKSSKNAAQFIINDLLFGEIEWNTNQNIWQNIKVAFDPKYIHFYMALNDLFYKLTARQHSNKFIFFMKNNMFDFQYCLNKGFVNMALKNLMNEEAFNKKAVCIKLICKWIYQHFESEKDNVCKKKIAEISIAAVNSYMTNILSSTQISQPDKEQVIIEQYLYQLKCALSSSKNVTTKYNGMKVKAKAKPQSKQKQSNKNDNSYIIPLGFYYFKAELAYRKNNGTIIFGKLLENRHFSYKQNQLKHQMNWDMLIDAIFLNLEVNDYFIVFKALRLVAQNLLNKNEKYRILYANNKTVQQRILSRIGGTEFICGLGFTKVSKHKLVCENADFDVVATAISAINAKLVNIGKQKTLPIATIHNKVNKSKTRNLDYNHHSDGAQEIELHNDNVKNNDNIHWTSMIKIVK